MYMSLCNNFHWGNFFFKETILKLWCGLDGSHQHFYLILAKSVWRYKTSSQ